MPSTYRASWLLPANASCFGEMSIVGELGAPSSPSGTPCGVKTSMRRWSASGAKTRPVRSTAKPNAWKPIGHALVASKLVSNRSMRLFSQSETKKLPSSANASIIGCVKAPRSDPLWPTCLIS